MQLKPGVRLLGVRPELLLGLIAADKIWQRQGVDLVVTSLADGAHMRGSRHYSGCAADLRARGVPNIHQAVVDLRTALGSDFDVILEGEGTPNMHCHIEYEPK